MKLNHLHLIVPGVRASCAYSFYAGAAGGFTVEGGV